MGGLITRYAIAQTERGHKDFPPQLRIEDVVTLGTPHGGMRESLVRPCAYTQCRQMRMGSRFLNWLEDNAWEPDGYGGTDWSTIGSDDDPAVTVDRAVGTADDRDPSQMYIGSCHKTWYTTNTDYLHDTSPTFLGGTAWAYHRCFGGWTKFRLPRSVPRTDLALTYGTE